MAGFTICAHRGASGQAPENTRSALERAVALGATMAEVDLQVTRDGHLVLFHDGNLERTSDGQGILGDHSLAQLRRLDVGAWFGEIFTGERILTVAELAELARDRLKLNLELKSHGRSPDLLEAAMRHLPLTDLQDFSLLSSFDHDLIRELGRRLPGWPLGLIVGRGSWQDSLLAEPVAILSLEASTVTRIRVRQIQESGKELHVWTVDDPGEMRRLAELGVDVLITNHPEIAADESGGGNLR